MSQTGLPQQQQQKEYSSPEQEQYYRELRENESQAQLGQDDDDHHDKANSLTGKSLPGRNKSYQDTDLQSNNIPAEDITPADAVDSGESKVDEDQGYDAGLDDNVGDETKSRGVDGVSGVASQLGSKVSGLKSKAGEEQKAPTDVDAGLDEVEPQPISEDGLEQNVEEAAEGKPVEKADSAIDGVRSEAGDLPEEAEGAAAEAGSKAGDVTGDIGSKVGDVAGDVGSKVGDVAGDVGSKAGDLTGEVDSKAGDVTGEVDSKAGDAAAETGDKVGDAAEEAGEKVDEVGDKAEEAAEEVEKPDLSILKNGKVNKGGNIVNGDGKVIGRVVEGVLARLVGKRVDENGAIWNDSGEIIGRAETIPNDEIEGMTKEAGPFEAFPDAVVDGKGMVVSGGEEIGKVIEGDIKKLRGMSVDPDGDILDRGGNVVGKAERWEAEPEPEPEPEAEVDRSILAGKRVNKAGNVVDSSGTIFGRVVEGDPKRMIGRMCDKKGNILSESGDIIGRAEIVTEGEREGLKEGPFAELEGCTVTKEGKVVTPGGDVVGRLVSGDGKKLFGRAVDEDGDVVDKNGNVLGKAERWEEPEIEKKKNALAGRRVNREGNVVDEDGNLVGRLTSGQLSICSGKEIDDDGDVVDGKGNTIGHVSLLEEIPPEPVEEESAEDKAKRELDEKDKELAKKMSMALTQVLDKVKPICDMITRKIEKADRTPKEELDEEELVKEVRPLIEEGGRILQEANGVIRGLDPDGRIQANAKHKTATHEASPEEYHLADILKELTGTVTKCIEDAKKRLEGMPHAKKELNPLWGLLSEPLFQILAAVGLLLNGVLGIVGRLLSGLGLGGLVDSLLGGLGVKQILQSLGIGSLTDSLTGKNQKKKSGGGLLGLGG